MPRAVIFLLFALHTGLLAWQAYRYSPTVDEPAHLVAGISHWKFGRFDLYRVNPPLVRLVAALPMLIVNPTTDWSAFTEVPYARPEFEIATDFASANGFDTFWYFALARWACIPFSLIGGWYCYLWARDLYGGGGAIGAEGQGMDFTKKRSGFGGRDSAGRQAAADQEKRMSSIHTGGTTYFPNLSGAQRGERVTYPGRPYRSSAPGLTALTLWCFCPNILGNGTLITPDVAAASLGAAAGYHFWRWLRTPTWLKALFAGFALGMAELTKSSWIILFVLWPALSFAWCLSRRKYELGDARLTSEFGTETTRSGAERCPAKTTIDNRLSKARDSKYCIRIFRSAAQLAAILALALYILNLGYGFENSFRRLDTFEFISKSLGGPDAHEKPGNRFAGSWMRAILVPVPANYLRGIDVQKYDFEKGKWSYLRGEQRMGGWWYYHLYGIAVKMPVGTLFLLTLACVLKATGLKTAVRANALAQPTILDEVVLLAPAVLLIALVSSQTGFSRYLRYVVPAFPFLYIWVSQLACTTPPALHEEGGLRRMA